MKSRDVNFNFSFQFFVYRFWLLWGIRKAKISLISSVLFLRKWTSIKLKVDRQNWTACLQSFDWPHNSDFSFRPFIADVLNDYSHWFGNNCIGTDKTANLMQLAFLLSQIHTTQFNNLLFRLKHLPLELNRFVVGIEQDGNLAIVGLSPFWHDQQKVLSRRQLYLKGYGFFVVILAVDPLVFSVVQFCKEKCSNPKIFCVLFHIKPVLLLSDWYEPVSKFLQTKSPQRCRLADQLFFHKHILMVFFVLNGVNFWIRWIL